MKHDYEGYAKGLIAAHGYENALSLVEKSLKHCKSGASAQLTMFGEADFHINNNGQYVYSKVQTDKTAAVKAKRIKDNINFYYTVLNLMKHKLRT